MKCFCCEWCHDGIWCRMEMCRINSSYSAFLWRLINEHTKTTVCAYFTYHPLSQERILFHLLASFIVRLQDWKEEITQIVCFLPSFRFNDDERGINISFSLMRCSWGWRTENGDSRPKRRRKVREESSGK